LSCQRGNLEQRKTNEKTSNPMKTIKNQRSNTILGTVAALSAVSTANASIVQITLTGNQLSSTSGNDLNADLTGDSVPDVTFAGTNFGNSNFGNNGALVSINGGLVSAQYFWTASYFRKDAQFAAGGTGNPVINGYSPNSSTYYNPISFSDSRIQGGATITGYLYIETYTSGQGGEATVNLLRLIFDDAFASPDGESYPGTHPEWVPPSVSAVPEPTNNLALLACGAGGLLIRRRMKRAA
jgi:hypothetical protein